MLLNKSNTMKPHIAKFTSLIFIFSCLFACKSNDDEGTNINDATAENRKALGVSAADLLSDDTYTSMTVELVYTAAFAPRQSTIDDFRTLLTERVNKPGGINFIETVIEPPAGAPFSTAEIREIENEVRTQYTSGDTIAVYVFFASGNNVNDTNTTVTLGTAYQNTSIVVYEKTLREITVNEPELLPILEATTLLHEFGHIFGLVNIQNDDIHPGNIHEDPDRAKHCIVGDCLMFFEATNVGKSQVIETLKSRAQTPEFDPLCLEDLRAKGGR